MAAERLQPDEVLKLISDRAAAMQKESKAYLLRLKILRRPERVGINTIGSIAPVHIATFDDAEAHHLLSAEQWLPLFAGGGRYAFDIRTPENPTGFGVFPEVSFEGQPPRDPSALNFEALDVKDWVGPRLCVYPARTVRPAPSAAVPISVVAPLPGPLNGSAPPTHSPGANPATVPPQPDVLTLIQGVTQRFELKLAEMQANNDLRERERVIKEEADRRVAEAKEELRRTIAEMKAAQPAPVQPAGPSTPEIVTAVLTAATPIMKMIMDSQAERDRERREEQRRADEQRREDARLREEQRRDDLKRADDDRRLFLEKLFAKPEISPEMKMLIDKTQDMLKSIQDGQQSPTEAAQQIMQLTSSVTSMGLQLIQQAQHAMGGGDPESPWVKVAEHVSNAVRAMIPAHSVAPRLPPRTASARPAPAQSASREPVLAAQPNAAPSATPIIDKIEHMIRNMDDVNVIAKYLMDNFTSEEITKVLTEHDGDLVEIMTPRLETWVAENLEERQPYLMALFKAIDAAYTAAGHKHPDDDEGEDVAEEDDAGPVVESTGTPVPAPTA